MTLRPLRESAFVHSMREVVLDVPQVSFPDFWCEAETYFFLSVPSFILKKDEYTFIRQGNDVSRAGLLLNRL